MLGPALDRDLNLQEVSFMFDDLMDAKRRDKTQRETKCHASRFTPYASSSPYNLIRWGRMKRR